MSVDQYTVVLRGETFTLYRDQIEFDSPNYFTALFLGDFRESRTRRVALSRSAELFRVVVEYLSGYMVLPLAPAMIPSTMTAATALANLLSDAEYYQLAGLVRLIRPAPCALIGPPEAYRALHLAPRATLNFEDIINGADLNVNFDRSAGIGVLVGRDWQSVLISMEGMRMIYDNGTLRPMLSTGQKEALVSRGVLVVYVGSWRGPHYLDGAPYWVPSGTVYGSHATTRFNGQNISPQVLNRLCFTVLSPNAVAVDLNPADTERSATRALQAALKGESGNIILWCTKLVFSIAQIQDAGVGFRIQHADCVTRERFVTGLIF